MLKRIEDKDSNIKKDIIINGIMRSKGVYLLVSQPKVGKSMLALQLADSITNGKPFLGHKVIASPVLYISTESDLGQLQERLNTLNLKPKKDSLFIIDRYGKASIKLLDIEYEIHQFATEYNGKFLIIDMLKDMDFGISYDINSYQDIAQLLMPKLRSLCDKYNLTILITHHLNKQNLTLGSTAFDASVDGIITLKEYKNNKKHIKMVISNRDFEGLDLELKKSDNQLFSICESLDEEVENINLINFVKYASEKGRFEFTATSIVKDAKLLLTPKSMGRLINSNLALLEKEGLRITQKRTAKERLYECCYVEPSDEEELDSSSKEND